MVSLREIRFRYGKKEILDSLRLELRPGSIYGLLGRNGAGKTTLLKLLAGQLSPLEGSIAAFGRKPFERKPAFLADIFFLPEEFSLPAVGMERYVNLMSPFYPRFSRELFDRYLREFELPPEGGKISDLSFGQKKKFLLAFALAAGTSLLLLDEPTNGLDIPSKTQFRRTVASAAGSGRIILISTHQIRDMENLIDPLVIIDAGRVLLNASMEEIGGAYAMTRYAGDSPRPELLYSETVPGGRIGLSARRPDQEESALDLEIFFNFVIQEGGVKV